MTKLSFLSTTDSTNGANGCGTDGPEHGAGLSWWGHVWGQRHVLSEHRRRIRMLPAAAREFIVIKARVVSLSKRRFTKCCLFAPFHRLTAVRTICIAAMKAQCVTWSTPNVSIRRCLCLWWHGFLPGGHSPPLRWTLASCWRLLSHLTFALTQIGLLFTLDWWLIQEIDW